MGGGSETITGKPKLENRVSPKKMLPAKSVLGLLRQGTLPLPKLYKMQALLD